MHFVVRRATYAILDARVTPPYGHDGLQCFSPRFAARGRARGAARDCPHHPARRLLFRHGVMGSGTRKSRSNRPSRGRLTISVHAAPPALYGRGLIYQGDKQHEQAIADFTAASGLTPQRAEPLLARANSYLALDKVKEAASDLDEAVQADPNSAQAWSARGIIYERLGDKAKASASYGRALALRPKDEAARTGLARTGG